MQRIHQTAALLFIVGSAFVVWEALNLDYYSKLGPGAGFFPFWLGLFFGCCHLSGLSKCPEIRQTQRGSLPSWGGGTGRIVSILVALVILVGS